MPYDIVIVKNDLNPDWGGEGCINFGDVDPHEWESLFFNDFEIETYWDYYAKQEGAQSYDDYYSGQIALLVERYPMIARIKDFYEDAVFYKDEVKQLVQEIESLKLVVKFEKSQGLLNQLLNAGKLALENDAGIQLIAD